MAYSQAWFDDTTVERCLVVLASVRVGEVGGTNETIVMSSRAISLTDVTVLPIIVGGADIVESISLDGSISVSYGDIEIDNTGGAYDTWLDPVSYIWTNRSISIYYGDPSTALTTLASLQSTYSLVFNGVISDIDSKSRNTINFKVLDKMERLNSPLTDIEFNDDESVGGLNVAGVAHGVWYGGNTNKEAILPLVFGEVFNIEPLLIDPATLEYMANNADSSALLEVRDTGVPLWTLGDSSTQKGIKNLDLSAGSARPYNNSTKFKLSNSPAGIVTISIQGVKASINLSTGALTSTYTNKLANLIALIVTQYGKASDRLAAADLDLANLAEFDALYPSAPVGIMVNDRTNTLDVCQQLASSLGAQLFFTRTGLLRLIQVGIYTSATAVDITDSDIILDSLRINSRTPPIAAQKLGYAKNWTIQKELTTSRPQAHKKMFGKEWYTLKASTGIIDANIKSVYKLNNSTNRKNTMLLTTTAAQAECDRLQAYYQKVRTVYGFTARARCLTLEIGQRVNLTHNRFNLNNTEGQVVSLSPKWLTGLIDVEVLV